MTDIREPDKIYHGCFNKNKDGTNTLIKKGEKCLTPFGNVLGMFQMML